MVQLRLSRGHQPNIRRLRQRPLMLKLLPRQLQLAQLQLLLKQVDLLHALLLLHLQLCMEVLAHLLPLLLHLGWVRHVHAPCGVRKCRGLRSCTQPLRCSKRLRTHRSTGGITAIVLAAPSGDKRAVKLRTQMLLDTRVRVTCALESWNSI